MPEKQIIRKVLKVKEIENDSKVFFMFIFSYIIKIYLNIFKILQLHKEKRNIGKLAVPLEDAVGRVAKYTDFSVHTWRCAVSAKLKASRKKR